MHGCCWYLLLEKCIPVYVCVHGHWRRWWVKQELLEVVADEGLHCLAWQSNNTKAGYYDGGDDGNKDASSGVAQDTHDTQGVAKSFKALNGNTGVAQPNVEQEFQATLEQRLPAAVEEGGHQDAGAHHRLFKFQQPLDEERRREDEDVDEKFFIVQPLDGKATDAQDQVVALMKHQDVTDEDITDMFRDIEIEDLEAEKENVVGGNNATTEVENVPRDIIINSPLVSKIHYRGDHKKLHDASKLDSCLETYEEIIT